MDLKDNLHGLIIATTGYNGNNLLFRHPPISNSITKNDAPTCPYALKASLVHDNSQQYNVVCSEPISKNLSHYSDDVLANLLVAGKSDFYERGFNLQIESILFVGCTKRISLAPQKHEKSDMDVMNISFAISSTAERYSAVLQKLAHQISTAIVHEKKRALNSSDSCACEFGMQASLGKFLRRIYEAVKTDKWVDVYLNKWIRVHCFLAPSSDANLTDDKSEILSSMKPYHTLLLLKSQEYIASRSYFHCSPTLTAFLRCYNPSRNFMSISSDCMLSPLHVQSIASSLVLWGYADIIYPLNDANIYAVHPKIDFKSLFESFNNNFSSQTQMTLVDVLVEFSIPAALKDHRDTLQHFISPIESQVFIWLLINKVLYQVHTYIYNIADLNNDTTTATSTNNDNYSSLDLAMSVKSDEGGEEFSNRSICSEKPTWLNNLEDFSISSRNSNSGYEDERLFQRVRKYFNGRHHFEEILFLEKIQRSVFLTLIDKYRYKLLLLEHEDPSICKL